MAVGQTGLALPEMAVDCRDLASNYSEIEII